jgi:hypothetical protein
MALGFSGIEFAHARDLQTLALQEFPRAMSFVRPGFDEPWR